MPARHLLDRDPQSLGDNKALELEREETIVPEQGRDSVPVPSTAVGAGDEHMGRQRRPVCQSVRSGNVSEPLDTIEDQVQPELELLPIVVAGLHRVLGDHLGERFTAT